MVTYFKSNYSINEVHKGVLFDKTGLKTEAPHLLEISRENAS